MTAPRPDLPWWRGPGAAPALVTGAAVAALAALGIALRLWLIAHDPIDADQAVVGLMARAIDHGTFPAFYWGQAYGGLEPYVTAVGVALFGLHPWVIDGTPSVLGAASAVVAWRLGRAVTGRHGPGVVAAAVTWAWSIADIWNSTREYGFRGVVLLCSLLVALAVAHLIDRATAPEADRPGGPGRWGWWVVLGAAAAVGWWASPEILYVAVPALGAVAWVVVRTANRHGPGALGPVGAGLVATGVALVPWLVASVDDHFASLSVAHADEGAGSLGYTGRLHVFLVHTMPMDLGAKVPVTGAWLGGPVVGPLVLAVTLAVLGVGVVAAAWRYPAARPLAAACLAYPFIEAAMGPTSFWLDGRYGTYLPPLAAVTAVAGWYGLITAPRRHSGAPAGEGGTRPEHAGTRRRVADPSGPGGVAARPRRAALVAAAGAVVLCGASAASTVAGLDAFTVAPATGPDSGFAAMPSALTGDPDTTAAAVVRSLLAHRITHVYADYWVAYDLDVVSPGPLLATPPDIVRMPALARSVERARRAGWLFVGPTPTDAGLCAGQFQNPSPQPFGLTAARFRTILATAGISASTVDVGPMVAVVPAENVSPGWVVQRLAAD